MTQTVFEETLESVKGVIYVFMKLREALDKSFNQSD